MCPGGAANARTPTSRDTFALSADPLVALSLPYVSPPHIHCAGVLDQIKITGGDDKSLLLDTPAHEPPSNREITHYRGSVAVDATASRSLCLIARGAFWNNFPLGGGVASPPSPPLGRVAQNRCSR